MEDCKENTLNLSGNFIDIPKKNMVAKEDAKEREAEAIKEAHEVQRNRKTEIKKMLFI